MRPSHLNVGPDQEQPIAACGEQTITEYLSRQWGSIARDIPTSTQLLDRVNCPACLVALDSLIQAELSSVDAFSERTMIVTTSDSAFPYAPEPIAYLWRREYSGHWKTDPPLTATEVRLRDEERALFRSDFDPRLED